MIAVDTNVLVLAHRSDSDGHAAAARWLTRAAESEEPWSIPVFCLVEFLRVVTHPRVFDPPSTIEQALGFVESLAQSPSLRVLHPGERFLALLAGLMRAAGTRGNLVFDAQIAALCREHGVRRIVTEDRDFDRFEDVERVGLT